MELAAAAVSRLAELFENLPGSIGDALLAAGESAELLSSDRFQGISEIVQNADDVQATQVRIVLTGADLLLAHNGTRVTLSNVHALATPWLTTKADEAHSTGRFGIGLMTLRSIAPELEMHCSPYHVRLGASSVTAVPPFEAPDGLAGPKWTVVRVPVGRNAITIEELDHWLTRWDDSALLFLRHVVSIELLDFDMRPRRELSLTWMAERQLVGKVGEVGTQVVVRQAISRDGSNRWTRYTCEAPVPPGAARKRKAVGSTTPVGVAIPMQAVTAGVLSAGLPVASTQTPLWANAQFDPLSNRQDIATNLWNTALLALVADLWAVAALDTFDLDARCMWPAMPLQIERIDETRPSSGEKLDDLLLQRSRDAVGPEVTLRVGSVDVLPLSELAVEVERLEGILSEAQVAHLANLPAAIPTAARDSSGRWRRVLADWRQAGVRLPDEVDVEDALALLDEDSLDAPAVIALSAAAIDVGLAEILADKRCAILEDGSRVVPPTSGANAALVASQASLAEHMGIALRLHAAHLGRSTDARTVLRWLNDLGALLDATDAMAVLRRLSDAGNSGIAMAEALTDTQIKALRASFERLSMTEREEVGIGLGRAIRLRAFTFDRRGKKLPRVVHPGEAYLPKSIERLSDGFAEAAGAAPGIVWLDGRYSEVLRSDMGRSGLGALQFLRLLGAETAPRLRRHPESEWRYPSDHRDGVPLVTSTMAGERRAALNHLGARYTLQDYDSPDLLSVVESISRERGVGTRRRRSSALLSTLGRAWDRLDEFVERSAATDSYGWILVGAVHGFWLWSAGDIEWLDDVGGRPRRPSELRLRTPATVALYGQDASGYLRPEFDSVSRRAVLAALGVTGEPTMTELVERLVAVRAESITDESRVDASGESAVIYVALADALANGTRGAGSMSADQLQRSFARAPGLLHTKHGWRTPRDVLNGPPVFGDRRSFVPSIPGTGALWRALKMRVPGLVDALDVMTEMSRGRKALTLGDEVVLLETYRLIASLLKEGTNDQPSARRIARMPLWTSLGWKSARPIFAVQDTTIAVGLADHVAVWQPGGGLDQFRTLLAPLHISEIRASDTAVRAADRAVYDADLTHLFQSAIRLLRDDLTRNEEAVAASISMDWSSLEGFDVRIDPDLTVEIAQSAEFSSIPPAIAVNAKIDTAKGSVFVTSSDVLPLADGGGLAVASLFDSDHRRVAQAWRVAWDGAEDGRRADALVLAQQQADAEQASAAEDLEARTQGMHDRIGAKHKANEERSPQRGQTRKPGGPQPPQPGNPTNRVLVDPLTLKLRIREGTVVGSPSGSHRGADGAPDPKPKAPVAPKRGGGPPKQHKGPPGYTGLTKESVGLDLLRVVLAADDDQISDLRSQRGVGADAIDELAVYYELKVSAGSEPDQIMLTNSEVARAVNDPDKFFVVVVSGLEGGADAAPMVRIIANPLQQLLAMDSGNITLTGVRDAHSIVFKFDRDADADTGQ